MSAPSSFRNRPNGTARAALTTLLLVACGGDLGGLDAPCTQDAQCAQDLVCDVHAPRTCQEAHDHPGTGGHGGEAGTGGTTAIGGGGQAEGGASVCGLYCACMVDACAAIEGYPYEDEAACTSACEAFSADELDCFGSFCVQASQSPGAVDHLCEHAWGAAGTDEC